MREGFEYPFSTIDPVGGAHIDPPSVAIYETLLRKGPGGAALPGLAQSFTVAADGLSWRLRLRPGATFHSGQRCDASAVAAALHGCRWGGDPNRQLWYWDPVDAVIVRDEVTLEITLHHPYPRLPTLLWGTHTAIHNEQSRLRHGPDYGRTVVDGTGPYRLRAWSPEAISATRVAGADPGLPASLTWLSLTDEDERADAARSGRVSILRCPPAGLWQRLGGDDSGWRYVELPQDSNAYLALNFNREEFDFHRVEMRRALSGAIDRRRLVDGALAGHGQPALGPVPAHDPFYRLGDPAQVPPAQPESADATLDELGWLRQADGLRARDGRALAFTCVTQDDPVFHRAAELITADLLRIGVRVGFRFETPFADFYRACEAGPDALLNKWLWPDPMEAIIGFTASWCDGSPNWQHARIPRLDDAYQQWLRAVTDDEVDAAATTVQSVFAAELPYLPLYTPNDSWLIRSDVSGYRPEPGILYPEYLPASED